MCDFIYLFGYFCQFASYVGGVHIQPVTQDIFNFLKGHVIVKILQCSLPFPGLQMVIKDAQCVFQGS